MNKHSTATKFSLFIKEIIGEKIAMSNKNDLRPTSIAFSMDSYKTKDEFWKAVADQLRLLTDQDYYVLFRMDDCGVYVIEYEHDPHIEEWGCNRFMYVTSEEEDEVISNRVYSESGSEEKK